MRLTLQVDCHFSKHFNMNKHVNCIENGDKSDLYRKTSYLPPRSRLNHVEADKTTSRFGHKRQRPAKVGDQNRDIKSIYIPKAMTDAPFLQHPALTPGQKRFLYSIAEAYSTDHMRQLIRQHYMNVLHRCIRTDLNPHVKPKVTTTYRTESVTAQAEHITNSQTTTIFGTKEHGRKLVIAEKAKKTTLPKIISHQRVSSRFPKTNKALARSKTAVAKPTSLQRSRQWDVDLEWEMSEMDSYLSRRMSGMSLNESEEDFLFAT